MKGVPNRQKMLARPRETMQKLIIQQKHAQTAQASGRRNAGRKLFAYKGK